MRWTKTLIPTLKEDPADAESVSHKLMLRAGLIRKLSAGIYIYLPLGQRVLNKVVNIIRSEMDRAGALEVLLPALQTPELWEKTGRLKDMADIIYQFKDKSGKPCMLGPTHEEIITYLVANEVSSYRQLPVTLYQIQTKFRDELRPRFGIIRSKEFLMKDAYSFDADETGLNKSYQAMDQAYRRIFDRCGLNYKCIEGDSGAMGGHFSQEFMVPSPAGEDIFVTCSKCDYAATLMLVKCQPAPTGAKADKQPLKEVATPGTTTIEAVGKLLNVSAQQMVKTMICLAGEKPVAILLRGDHELNLSKLAKLYSGSLSGSELLPGIVGCPKGGTADWSFRMDHNRQASTAALLGEANITLAEPALIEKVTGGPLGFSGPVGLQSRNGVPIISGKGITIIADHAVMSMSNFVTGANKKDAHLLNVNLDRDFKPTHVADVRVVTEQDPCPVCQSPLKINNGLEVGHIFQLGTKYSKALEAMFLDEKGARHPVIMGCYGIGVNRIIAALIENAYDDNGIIWSTELAPYNVLIISINPADKTIAAVSTELYDQLTAKGIDVLWDDRDISPGVKFKDADLIGIPTIVTVGKGTIKDRTVDIKDRKTGRKQIVSFEKATDVIMTNV
ncbi:MAG: proline--tRNA ligase [Planctomycetes bacterium]|nr:proline--tRNA ligase [Planctomycetota bacterium]